jgi:uncharacterized repeat protein (TIGR03803 family)
MARNVLDSYLSFARNFILAENMRLRSSPLHEAAKRCAIVMRNIKSKMKNIKTLIIAIILFQFAIVNAQFTKLLDFSGTLNGQFPGSSLISDGIHLYGVTNYGGTNDLGTIFKIMPDGTGFIKLLDFAGASNGKRPRGNLVLDGVFLYGTTSSGGSNDFGTLYKIKTDGTNYTKLIDFSNVSSGNSPFGTLVCDNIYLYGTTAFGGINSNGVLFKVKKDGTGFTKLLDFSTLTNGANPWDSLFLIGNYLYGTTQYGGTNNNGVVFKLQTDGNGFLKLYDFGSTNDGRNPLGGLISDGTFLYGTTRQGGTVNKGTLFKIDTFGNGYGKIFDFQGTSSGAGPQSSLIFDGSFLLGMTPQGGSNNIGVIYKISTNGTGFSKLLDFDGANYGSAPLGSLFQDGNILYGMTSNGGISNKGTLFKYVLNLLSIQNIEVKPLFSIYPNPTNGIIEILSESEVLKSVAAFNILGQEVHKQNILDNNKRLTLDFTHLLSGIYFLKIISEKKQLQTLKFVKK